ncbi:MAG: hypothetical protein ABIZ49_04575 [Opitutaceae bacterium]
MKNITRNRAENCVMARVMREKVRHQKNFSLRDHKTWRAAEKAAAGWVRSAVKKLPPEMPRQGRLTVSNNSGVVGVHFSMHVVRKPSGREYEYGRWTARWHGCPNRGGVAWYVTDAVSDEDAFVRATLSLQMKAIDRSAVIERFEEIKRTKSYDDILALRK